MTLVEIIQHYQKLGLVEEDGEPCEFRLKPGLTEAQIHDFETLLGFALDEEFKDLLRFTNGLNEGPLASMWFSSTDDQAGIARELDFGWKTILIATDGFANDWAFVVGKDAKELGPIYYLCHDPPVFLYQSPNLAHFLEEMFKMCRPPFKSLVEDVHEDRLKRVWLENPDLISVEDARSDQDPVLSSFARTLPDGWEVIDLREPEIGAGFSFRKCEEFRRNPDAMIFGLKPKEPSRFSRWLRRLFSKFQ